MTNRAIAGRILDGILAQRRTADGGRTWEFATPYVLRHAIQHASDAGRADELLTDAEWLICGEPDSLVTGLDDAVSAEALQARAVYRTSLHRHRQADVETRRSLLALDASRLGVPAFSGRLLRESRSPWRPRWGTGSQVSPALRDTLDRLGGAAEVVVCGPRTDKGRVMALIGGRAAASTVWDLETGQTLQMSATEVTGRVAPAMRCAAVFVHDGRPMAVVADPEGQLWLWNLATGFPASEPFAVNVPATRIEVASLDSGPVVLAALGDGTVRVVSISDGTAVRELDTGQDRPVYAMTTLESEGRWIAVVICADRTVSWELATGEMLGVIALADSAVTCVAPWWLGDDDLLLIGDGRSLSCVDLSGELRWTLAAPASAVAVTRLRDRPVAVVGGTDGTLRLWDLLSREPLHRPWRVSRASVDALGVADLGNRTVAVTGDDEGYARLWDLDIVTAIGEPIAGHDDEVTGIAIGRTGGDDVILTACGPGDSCVRTWTAADGSMPKPIWEGHDGPVTGLVRVEGNGGQWVLAGSHDGVRVHELASGYPVGALWAVEVRSLAAALIGGRLVGVVGDAYGSVSVWDVLTGRPLGAAWPAHEAAIYALALAEVGSKGVIVTCGYDGTVGQWSLDTGERLTEPVRQHVGRITGIVVTELDGHPVALTSGKDGTVAMHHLLTGEEFGPVWRPAAGELDCVATGTVNGDQVVLAGARDGVHMLRIGDGVELPTVATPAAVRAVAMTQRGDLVIGTGWDVVVMEPTLARGPR